MKVYELQGLNPEAEVLVAIGQHLLYGANVVAIEACRPSVPNGHYWERDPRTPTATDQIIILVPAAERARAEELAAMAKPKEPDQYKCGKCGALGLKLWRLYQTFLEHQRLYCRACAIKDQKVMDEDDLRGDQVGNLIPAVPDLLPARPEWNLPAGYTFWGYTSVPQECVAWWKAMPAVSPVPFWERALDTFADRIITKVRKSDNGVWYASLDTGPEHQPGDPDFACGGATKDEAVQSCAKAIRADARGDGKYAPHSILVPGRYDFRFRLAKHWAEKEG